VDQGQGRAGQGRAGQGRAGSIVLLGTATVSLASMKHCHFHRSMCLCGSVLVIVCDNFYSVVTFYLSILVSFLYKSVRSL
jgi:hypothetical protein